MIVIYAGYFQMEAFHKKQINPPKIQILQEKATNKQTNKQKTLLKHVSWLV